MDFANTTLGDDETAAIHHQRKHLSLEARHSKAIESARKLRLNLSTSIFIPKQPVKSQTSPRTPSTTSPKKLPQQGATDKPNQSLDFTPTTDAVAPNELNQPSNLKRKFECKQTNKKGSSTKRSKPSQYRKLLLEGTNVIQTKLWLPPKTPKHNEVLSDQSIEDELKSMGLEVTSDTEEFENAPANSSNSTDDIVKSLSSDETQTQAKEQIKDVDVLKSTEISKSVQGKQTRKPVKKQSKIVNRNLSKIPERNCGFSKSSKVDEKFQSYNDSLHAVEEFRAILQTISIETTLSGDHEINRNLVELRNSINDFSAFLFNTYRNLELLEALPRRINRNPDTTQPSTSITQAAPEFVVRIDVPNMMEQVITFNTTEILQHTIENYEKGECLRQKRESSKKRNLEKSTKPNTERHSVSAKQTEGTNQTTGKRKPPKEQIQEPTSIPHPAFRNHSVQAEQQSSSHTEATNLYPAYLNHNALADHHRLPTQETPKESAVNFTYNNSPLAGQWNTIPEATIHPAFRTPIGLAGSKGSSTQSNCIMPQEDHMQTSNSSSSSATDLNPINSKLQTITSNLQHTINANHPQTSTSAENQSPHLANFLRPSVIHQPPRPLNIPYPLAQHIVPADSREFLATHHSPSSNLLLTPPQSIDCQSSPIYRPLPYHPYPGYNQPPIIPMTPPSEDIRCEAPHPYQPPPILPLAQGVFNHDRWPHIYKDMEVPPYTSYLKNALSAAGLFYPQTYGEF